MVLAIKYNEDDYYSNTFYAKVGGITLEEINKLEAEFLKHLTFTVFVDEELYNKYTLYLKHYEN